MAMSILKQIIEGHINEIRSVTGTSNFDDEKVFESRARICAKCPLKKGNTCDRSKYIDPETLKVYMTWAPGLKQGCGCRLSAKQKSKGSKCPAEFWGREFN